MLQKISLYLFIIIFSLFTPLLKIYAQSSNVGFVSGNIWYSEDPFKEGDKITIHTLVYNSDSRELSGTVFFFDKTLFLGNRSLTVAPKSSSDVSIDWTVTAGSHTIFAQIQNPKFLLSSGKYETAVLSDVKSDESSRTVEKTIIPVTDSNTNNINSDTVPTYNNNSIVQTIKNNTPEIVSTSIDTTVNALEGVRESVSSATDKSKNQVQKDINTLEGKNTPPDTKVTTKTNTKDTKKVTTENAKTKTVENTNFVQKPFLYIKLFFLSLFSFIFGNKLIFYAVLLLLVFLLLRFLWRLIF